VVVPSPDGQGRVLLAALGFRALGPQMVRVDMIERLARHALEARAGRRARPIDDALVTSLGLLPASRARLMTELGFKRAQSEAGWIWRGRSRPREEAGHRPGSAFAALAELRRG